MESKQKVERSDIFCGNSGEDDSWYEGLGCSKQCTQTFLYVHQTSWQQRLLEGYGSTISLLDATYKTTRYDLALFFSVLEPMLVTWL